MISSDIFTKGDRVKVDSPGHRMDGKVGVVLYYGTFMGTWGVDFNGQTYGFFVSELIKEESKV